MKMQIRNSGFLALQSGNRSSMVFQMMNGGVLKIQLLRFQLKSPTAMDDVQWNSARKQLFSCEIVLAEVSTMMVDGEPMNNGTSSLEIFQKKSR